MENEDLEYQKEKKQKLENLQEDLATTTPAPMESFLNKFKFKVRKQDKTNPPSPPSPKKSENEIFMSKFSQIKSKFEKSVKVERKSTKKMNTTPIRKSEKAPKSEIKNVTKSIKTTKFESQSEQASEKKCSAVPKLELKTREAQQGVSSHKTDSKTEQGTGSCNTSYTDLDRDIPKRKLDAPHHQEHLEHRQPQPAKEPQHETNHKPTTTHTFQQAHQPHQYTQPPIHLPHNPNKNHNPYKHPPSPQILV